MPSMVIDEARLCLTSARVATLETFGQLDILVNNAGYTQVIPHQDLGSVSEEVFRRVIDVNLFGTWYLSRAAVAALKASGDGNIVNIT